MNDNKSHKDNRWRRNTKSNFTPYRNKSFHDYGNSTKTFIPHIFKDNPSKPSIVSATDPFITAHSAKEYCSLLSTDGSGLPRYLKHFKEFTDNVLDIPDHVFDDIAKVHMERENKFKEEEEEEERRQAHQLALELKEKSSMDKKVAKILKARKYYVKRCCPVKIPFKSTLTHDEHEFYLKCFIKFQIRRPINALEEQEYEQYLSMQNRVFDEQSCMINFSYKVAQLVLNEYNNVPLIMENYIKEYVSHRCQRASSYSSKYKGEVEIPLKVRNLDSSADNFQFTHIGHLLSLGNVPWIYLPKPYFKTSLPKDESVGMKRRPDRDEDFDRNYYLYKCPVSEDPNAEYLAKFYHASVVMTPSAFKIIMDNQEQPFDKEWNIPVRIKSYKVKDDNGKESDMRIIYIDKPLPRKTWLPLQKKYTFYKSSAKLVLTGSLRHNVNFFRLRRPDQFKNNFSHKSRRTLSAEDNIFGSISSDESVDNFGGESSNFSSRSDKYNPNKKKQVLPDKLAKDLFLSEDEEDSRNSFEQGQNNPNRVEVSSTPSNSNHAGTVFSSPPTTVGVNADCSSSSNGSRGGAAFAPPSSYEPVKSSCQKAAYARSIPTKRREQSESIFHTPKKAKFNDKDSTGFLDDILDKQDSFLKLKTSPASSQTNEALNSMLNPFDSPKKPAKNANFSKPWSKTIMKEWDQDYQIKDCPPGGDVNVHYQLFSFANLKQCPVKEECPKPVKILVRHSVHGLSKNKKEHPRAAKAFVMFPKIENQVYFGAEVNSLSEIIHQWADLLLRPNTHLLQVRVCTESGDVLMTDEKTLETVLKEAKQQHLNFNPQLAFSSFNVLINTLMKMSSGEYLLHHSPKTEAFMKLMKAFDSNDYVFSSSLDLHQFYSDSSIASKQYRTSPWLAIDTHVLTPFHFAHNKIPGTFPMENKKKLSKHERQKRKSKANNKLSLDGYH